MYHISQNIKFKNFTNVLLCLNISVKNLNNSINEHNSINLFNFLFTLDSYVKSRFGILIRKFDKEVAL